MRATVIAFIVLLGLVLLVTVTGGRHEKPGKCPPNSKLSLCVQLGSADRGCSNDYECEGDRKCCPKGCNHMCVTPEYDKSAVKKEQCPGAPAPPYMVHPNCENDGGQSCSSDGDCPGIEKCCQTYCNKKCTKPGNRKPGRCPAESFKSCHGYMVQNCDFDSQCPGEEKCCANECELRCTKVWIPSPKKGLCPGAPARPSNCKEDSGKRNCASDSDCTGTKKCCPSHCDMFCTEPDQPKGKCPMRYESESSSESCEHSVGDKCVYDTDCDEDEKCCLTKCKRRCVHEDRPGKCPVSPNCPHEIPKENYRCHYDIHCRERQKCCFNGCWKECKDPIY